MHAESLTNSKMILLLLVVKFNVGRYMKVNAIAPSSYFRLHVFPAKFYRYLLKNQTRYSICIFHVIVLWYIFVIHFMAPA